VSIDLNTLLEYAGIRFADGQHLAERVINDLEQGCDLCDLRARAAQSDAYLTAYFADCAIRIQEATDQ
jgi:hypothetical protein